MAVSARPIGVLLLKWLCVPIVFGLAGYYVVGPRLAAPEKVKGDGDVPETHFSTAADNDPANTNTKPAFAEPDVSVSVERPKHKSTFSRKRKKKVEPPPMDGGGTDAPTAPPADPPANDGG